MFTSIRFVFRHYRYNPNFATMYDFLSITEIIMFKCKNEDTLYYFNIITLHQNDGNDNEKIFETLAQNYNTVWSEFKQKNPNSPLVEKLLYRRPDKTVIGDNVQLELMYIQASWSLTKDEFLVVLSLFNDCKGTEISRDTSEAGCGCIGWENINFFRFFRK